MAVMVMDDNLFHIGLVSHILRMYGFDVLEAQDIEIGLRILDGNEVNIELIITDYVMPEMDGLQFALSIRKREKYTHIPIMLLTNRTDIVHGVLEEYQIFDVILHKPIEPDAFIRKVQTLICESDVKFNLSHIPLL